MGKNLFDPELENFNETKRLNKMPQIIIICVAILFLGLLLFVIFSAGVKDDNRKNLTSLETTKKDKVFDAEDDYVRNNADIQGNERYLKLENEKDFREVLAKQDTPVSSRTDDTGSLDDNKSIHTGFYSSMPIPVSMLDDNLTIFDRDDTYSSVHLTTTDIVSFRQKRFDSLDEALKSSISVYRGNGSNDITAVASTQANTGVNNQQLSYQEQLQKALATSTAQASAPVSTSATNQSLYASNDVTADNKWKLANQLEAPDPNMIKTGSIIPATLITEINSTVQGQITGQVRNNVYDTATGKHLLIPQGTRLVGTYATSVPYGQNRLYIAWNRLVFPNGSSLDIDVMPGADMTGKAGFKDEVNNHYLRIFGNALLLSLVVAGVNVSQKDLFSNFVPFYLQSSAGALSESLGQNLGETMSQMIRKNLNIAPEIIIRAGYLFNIMVTKDITLPVYR